MSGSKANVHWVTLRIHLDEKPNTDRIEVEGIGQGRILHAEKADDREGYWATCYFEVESVAHALSAIGDSLKISSIRGGEHTH